jgi:putative spermidine/putrescine transport system permease protein
VDIVWTRPIWAFLTGPYAVLLLVLLLVPFANIAMYSVHPYSPTNVFLPNLTSDNYLKIFDLYYVRLFGRTLRLGLITTAVCVVLGYPLSYCLARARPRWQAVGLFLLIMPLMVSAVIRIFGWIVVLGRKGLVNQALVALGLEPVKLLYRETAVVIGLVNIFVPFMVLPIMASIERISPSLEEAAQNLGADWYRMFRGVILPLSLPGLIPGCLLVYSPSISAFVTPALMGNPRERMAGQQIYDEVLVSFNWPGASSLSLTLCWSPRRSCSARCSRPGMPAGGRRRRERAIAAAAAVRRGRLSWAAGAARRRHRGVLRPEHRVRISAARCDPALVRGVLRRPGFCHRLLPSEPRRWLASGGAGDRPRDQRRLGAGALTVFRARSCGNLLSCAAARAGNSAGSGTIPVLCAACGPGIDLDVALCPFSDLHALWIRSVTAGLIGLDPRLEEVSMSLSATRVQAFFKVTLPLLRSSLVSGEIFAFIISFSDINLALFLSGPQSTSLPVHIFSEIQW